MALEWIDNFEKPKTVTEALERSAEFARAESRWVDGSLFELNPKYQYDQYDRCGISSDGGNICRDVKACAVGILVIATLDGPAVKSYFEGKFREAEQQDPIFCQAVAEVAMVLGGEPLPVLPSPCNYDHHQRAIKLIERYNDSLDHKNEEEVWDEELQDWTKPEPETEEQRAARQEAFKKERKEHHQKIVKAFRTARDNARKKGI